MLHNISAQLEDLSNDMFNKVEAVASGKTGPANATFEYVLTDLAGDELQSEWQDTDYVSRDEVMNTAGYQLLSNKTRESGIQLKLLEEQIEEVDDEDRNRIVVQLSGWAS